MAEDTKQAEYDLLLLLSTLGANKVRVLLILAHLYPKAVSATQLSKLLGYSLKARTIYRGILDDMKARDLVYVDKLTPKVSSIRLNHDNPLLKRIIDLSQEFGEEYIERISKILEQKNE